MLQLTETIQKSNSDPLKVALVKTALEECRTKKGSGNLPSPELALHMAAAARKIKCVETLINYPKNIDINQQDLETQRTPLHFAIIYNQPSVASLLIEAGARLDIQDSRNKAINYMTESGNQEIRKYKNCLKLLKRELN